MTSVMGTAVNVAIQLRNRDGTTDVSLSLTDPDTSVADVFDILGVRAGSLVDGLAIANPGDLRAIDTLMPGSQVVPDTDIHDLVPAPVPAEAPAAEVAVVAGLDAGWLTSLPSGLHKTCGFYLQIPEADAAAARPWHHHGGTVEAVLGDGLAIGVGRPVETEPGHSSAVHRPHRPLPAQAATAIELRESPEQIVEPGPLSWATVLAPVPVALLMAVMFRPIFALFAAMGPVMALGRWFESRRRHRRDCAARQAIVDGLQAELLQSLDRYVEQVAVLRWQAHPHVAELWRRARTRSVRLWERRPGEPGYLAVTVGVAPDQVVPACTGAAIDPQVHELVAGPTQVRAVPHMVDLQANTGLGVHGDRDAALAVARACLLQLASLHGPADVTIGVVCAEQSAHDWDWIKWLPHHHRSVSSTRSFPVAKHFADQASTVTTTAVSWSQTSDVEAVTVIVIDDIDADVAAIHRAATQVGRHVRFVVVAPSATMLPAACSALMHAHPSSATLMSPELAGRQQLVCPTGVSLATAVSWARALTGLADPELTERSVADSQTVSLLGLIDSPNDLGRRWVSRPTATFEAPIGIGPDGPHLLNLTEDGPHMLIAGTTGSGKSELLRTLVLSFAAQVPPDYLNFVLIDFKGGGAFDAIDQLPHVVGLITDLDESLVSRAITSLQAELVRREQLFRALGVSSFDDAVTASPEPLARLVVVIDEFAALATDYGDLMTAIVDLAARGRSLGMHLVLATQRPSGVVDQKIRANTNIRIALRVQDSFDSHDVVGTGDAAAIDRRAPGRAIVCVGGDAPVVVQTAFSGTASSTTQGCTVHPHLLFGDSVPGTDGTQSTQVIAEEQTELHVLVEAMIAAAADRGLHRLSDRQLWAEPLPGSLDWIDLASRQLAQTPVTATGGIALGLQDIPDRQTQEPWTWDPSTGSLALYAASASCAGNTLVSVAAALVSERTTEADEPTHLYVLDGGAGHVRPLQALAETGGYATIAEPGRIDRTVRFFEEKLVERRSCAVAGPRLILMIDNIAAVGSVFDESRALQLADRLAALARDGAHHGVHLVVSARTARDLGHRLSQQFPHRLVMALADMTGYLTLGLHARDVPVLSPMRAIDMATQRLVQLVDPPDLGHWIDSAESARAEQIGTFAHVVPASTLSPAVVGPDRIEIPVGIDAVDLQPVMLRLRSGQHCLVVASDGLGRSNAVRLMLDQLSSIANVPEIVRIAPLSSPLRDDTVGRLVDTVDDIAALAGSPAIVIVDDADRLVPAIADAVAALIAEPGADLRVIAATTPAHVRKLRSWVRPLVAEGTAILLSAPTNGDVLGIRCGELEGMGRLPGRGVVVSAGRSIPVQIAQISRE